jgi:8-oxo-dGTP diphosphatase
VAVEESGRRVEGIGPVARRLAANLRELRDSRRLTTAQLSSMLAKLGRPIPATGITKTEASTRRVDVDDLVALAAALGVSPNRLLLSREITVPGGGGGLTEVRIELTPSLTVRAGDAWKWAAGEQPLEDADRCTAPGEDTIEARTAAQRREAFVKENRPHQGDWHWDVGLFVGDARYVTASVLGTLQAALQTLKPDALRQLTEVAIAQEAGIPAEYAAPVPQQPVVAAIVTSAKGVLIGRRNDRTPPWTFIAGEQEPDEHVRDTVEREVKEETGVEVAAQQIIGERVHPATGRHMIYVAAAPTHETPLIVGDEAELAEVRWVSLAEADELLPGMYEPVRDYLEQTIGVSGGSR